MNVTDLARVVYEANRAYCRTLGDTSFTAWEIAPDWQKATIVDGIALFVSNPDVTPEQSHENWLKRKREDGWVYGPVKAPDATPPTHPCILPYGELSPEQRRKDRLFLGIVRALTADE